MGSYVRYIVVRTLLFMGFIVGGMMVAVQMIVDGPDRLAGAVLGVVCVLGGGWLLSSAVEKLRKGPYYG